MVPGQPRDGQSGRARDGREADGDRGHGGPPGFGALLHRHDIEDELFYVLDGEVTFTCAGREATFGTGGFAWLPKGLPHRFQISDSGPATMLQITLPAQFEDFARAVGEPAPTPALPEPSVPDVEGLTRIAADFQIEILPPTNSARRAGEAPDHRRKGLQGARQ